MAGSGRRRPARRRSRSPSPSSFRPSTFPFWRCCWRWSSAASPSSSATATPSGAAFWDHALLLRLGASPTFAQGVVLGAFIQGFQVEGRQFVGGSFDFLTPFSLFTGAGAALRLWLARRRLAGAEDRGRAAAMGAPARSPLLSSACWWRSCVVSVWTPLMNADIASRWFSWPNIVFLSPVPIRHRPGRLRRMARARRRDRSLAVRRRDRPVRAFLPWRRHQPVADDRAAAHHPVAGRVVA